jgi:hypothetical protein
MLRPYVEAEPGERRGEGNGTDATDPADTQVDTSHAEAFVRSQTIDKPAQVVSAIAAWWFSEYGSEPIKRADINKIADEIGVTVSSRPDKTLLGMRTDGKHVFRNAGRGALVPTVPHGELYFKNEYKVTKGKKKRADADES